MQIGATIPRALFGDLAEIETFVRGVEELGLHYVRLPDRVTSRTDDPTHEPLLLFAYLAAIAQEIEFVPAVLIAPSRQTVLLAKQIAELCLVASGRLRLGIAVGGNRREYAASGMAFERRGLRLEAQIATLRSLWQGRPTTGDGPLDSTTTVTIAPTPEHIPPIWIGTGEAPPQIARQRIARLADGWFVPVFHAAAPVFDDIRRYAEEDGRDLTGFGVEGEVSLVTSASSVARSIAAWRELPFVSHIALSTWALESNIANAHLGRLSVVVDALR